MGNKAEPDRDRERLNEEDRKVCESLNSRYNLITKRERETRRGIPKLYRRNIWKIVEFIVLKI